MWYINYLVEADFLWTTLYTADGSSETKVAQTFFALSWWRRHHLKEKHWEIIGWLVRRRSNGIGRISEVKLRRAGLVLGLVTFGGSTVLVFSWPLRPTQLGHLSVAGALSTGQCLKCSQKVPVPTLNSRRNLLQSGAILWQTVGT